MKRIFTLALALVALLTLAACTDTFHGDQHNDAYAQVTTSNGFSCTLQAFTYTNERYTAQADAIAYPYVLYLEDGDTATIRFACTACDHLSVIENVTAPAAHFFECDCITGDKHPDMCEALAINIILGSPPAEKE